MAAAGAETALRIGQGAFEHRDDIGGRQWIEAEEVAAAEERGVDVETRVVRGGADQAHSAFLHVGQQEVLLRFVEPVQLVDEQDRGRLGPAAGGLQHLAQLGDIGKDGVDPHETAFRFARDRLGQRRFAAARRAVEDEAAETVGRHEPWQKVAGPQDVSLADHLGERTRTHPGREWLTRQGRRPG